MSAQEDKENGNACERNNWSKEHKVVLQKKDNV